MTVAVKRARDHVAERNKRIARARRNVTCVSCGAPSVAGMYCLKHVLKQREKCAAFRRSMRAQGRCVDCGKPARGDGKARCAEHYERALVRQQRRRARQEAQNEWLLMRERLEEDRLALERTW